MSDYVIEYCVACEKLTHRPKDRDGFSFHPLYFKDKGPLCFNCFSNLKYEDQFRNLIQRNKTK
jgi:hypothetical protein